MIVEWEDGSALELGAGGCVLSVRDDTGQWAPAETGRPYYANDGVALTACEPSLPDTAMAPPGPDLTGPLVVLVLLATLIGETIRGRKETR